MVDFILPQALAQALLDYLAGHPYREVAPFVHALQQLQKVAPSVGAEEKKTVD